MLTGFKNFIMRGNVVDLAVAFVIGVAFSAIVNAIVTGLVNPLISMIFGKTDLSSVMTFSINNADFSFGLVLDGIIKFVGIAAVIYFCIVLPMNKLNERRKAGLEPEPEVMAPDIKLLEEIRDLLAANKQN